LAYASNEMFVKNDDFIKNYVYIFLDGAMNAQLKQTIRPKIESYVKRAEEIKGILKNGPVKKKAVADTANGRGNSKDNKGDDDDSGDPDKKRMMQKFEGIFHNRYISGTNMIFDFQL
jgi:hypothetical protein